MGKTDCLSQFIPQTLENWARFMKSNTGNNRSWLTGTTCGQVPTHRIRVYTIALDSYMDTHLQLRSSDALVAKS